MRKENTLLKHLNANTSSAKTKLSYTWEQIKDEYGVSDSGESLDLLGICENLNKKWNERPIVILMDEILLSDTEHPHITLNSLAESFPASVRIIAVINPRWSFRLPTLPESVLQIDLATPYRSTIAITSLSRFLAKCYGQDVPEGEFGSDVQGKKPIVFDVGADEDKLKMALQRSKEQLENDATLLYENRLPSSMKEICESQGKEKGGAWECYDADHFFGWEAEKVVGVTSEHNILEMITRAKTELVIILAEPREDYKKHHMQFYARLQKNIMDAAHKGLIDLEDGEGKPVLR